MVSGRNRVAPRGLRDGFRPQRVALGPLRGSVPDATRRLGTPARKRPGRNVLPWDACVIASGRNRAAPGGLPGSVSVRPRCPGRPSRWLPGATALTWEPFPEAFRSNHIASGSLRDGFRTQRHCLGRAFAMASGRNRVAPGTMSERSHRPRAASGAQAGSVRAAARSLRSRAGRLPGATALPAGAIPQACPGCSLPRGSFPHGCAGFSLARIASLALPGQPGSSRAGGFLAGGIDWRLLRRANAPGSAAQPGEQLSPVSSSAR